MSWIPWQSVHVGERETPRETASPWTLEAKLVASSAWHFPQVVAMFIFAIDESGFDAGWTLWLVWQSVHTAAFGLPRLNALA